MVQFGENMSFSPWHSLAAHEPLGEINEARRRVYPAISQFRRSENHVDDHPERLLSSTKDYIDLRSIVQIGREPARVPHQPVQSADVEGV